MLLEPQKGRPLVLLWSTSQEAPSGATREPHKERPLVLLKSCKVHPLLLLESLKRGAIWAASQGAPSGAANESLTKGALWYC